MNMVNMKARNRDKIISIILLIFWCLVIFYFSNQNGSVSENSSSHVLMFLNNIISIFSSSVDLTKSLVATFIVRKIAHMFLYFILYILCYYVACSYKIKKNILFSFIFCIIYATSDEIHQLFILERSFGIQDILIDLLGSFGGYLFLHIKWIRFFD